MKKFSVKTIVAIVVGAILFFVLGRFVSIPSPIPDTDISIQYGVLAFVAALFGPIAGFFTGLIGHFLIDFTKHLADGYTIWWSWIAASAFFGLMMGFVAGKINMDNGEFEKKDIIIFNVSQILIHLLAWLLLAPVLDVLVYKEAAAEAFSQGAFCVASNAVATAVVGTLLCISYAASKPKKGE
ncbi:MAG: ECF-type riboflavin transporter substrate-binding protein [Lachnospiraceae bacterium]|nr:ECF-type riboflavin transporter substrate-binding protein [Lachnospiraceae bacterium]